MSGFPWLTALILVPLVGAVVVGGLGSEQKRLARLGAFFFALVTLMGVVAVWFWFDRGTAGYQFVERHGWTPGLGIEYHLGIDGLGLVMILLTGLVTPMAVLVLWSGEERVPLLMGLLLFLEAGLLGTFTALNFVHWFLFWELSLIPAFLLIRLWGGAERGRASVQFFVYTMVGSVALLLAFLGLYLATGTFDFPRLTEMARSGELASVVSVRLGWHRLSEEQLMGVLFWMVFLGFAVKAPVLPFHTWLPGTYAEAPSGVTMMLSGLMSKMGVYGMLRVLWPIFPGPFQEWGGVLLVLAVLTVVLPALAALAQGDLKRVLAYSSLNHVGYCVLGVVAVAATGAGGRALDVEKSAALSGVVVQMFNHGITAAALFCFVALLERRSGGVRGMDRFGGLRQGMPVFAGLMGVALFSSLGLPGLNGFVGEFLIFKGVFGLASWAAVAALPGLLITAVFLLTLVMKVFCGPVNGRWAAEPDLAPWERALVVPAVGLMFALGIYPQLLTELVGPTVMGWLRPAVF